MDRLLFFYASASLSYILLSTPAATSTAKAGDYVPRTEGIIVVVTTREAVTPVFVHLSQYLTHFVLPYFL